MNVGPLAISAVGLTVSPYSLFYEYTKSISTKIHIYAN